MAVLSGLEPKAVWQYFEEICAIPHGSRNTRAIGAYCVQFARAHGLRCIRDAHDNVILFAPGTSGYEQADPLILQGHIDMVCEKEPDADIDMAREGLRLRTDGEWVWADGTTLGGDDGIAVAYAFAVLAAEDIPHPPIEVILTADEEIGMLGAAAIDLSAVRGRRLLNIDSEEEGIFLAGCAGGLTATCSVPVMWETREGVRVRVTISGLRGGHSGTEINKGRANANMLMGRLLDTLRSRLSFGICALSGGQKDNAIARDCTAELLAAEEDVQALCAIADACARTFREERRSTDPDICVRTQRLETACAPVVQHGARVIGLLRLAPDGVQRMSDEIAGLVQTSLNCGILRLEQDALRMTCSVRSSVNSEKQALTGKLRCLCELLGGSCSVMGEYPAWEYRAHSPLRDCMVETFIRQYGHAPEVHAIHAGLECGLFCGKLEDLDCVSFGPDIEEIHTTRERMSVASVQRTWELLTAVLAKLR